MMRELRRLWIGLPVWIILAGAVGLNGVLAFYQRPYGPEAYWRVVGQFWDKLGLAAVAAVVLTACLSLTACDRICRTEELVLAAKLGRWRLFARRMAACALGTVLFALALSVGNFLCGKVVADGLPVPPGWGSLYLGRTLLAGTGGGLLALAACGLCERFRSLPIAFILVSVVLLFSALTADMRGEPLGLYVLANGFFAKLIRGRALTGWGSYSPPWGTEWLVWGPWHVGLTVLCLYGAVRRRKERNQW